MLTRTWLFWAPAVSLKLILKILAWNPYFLTCFSQSACYDKPRKVVRIFVGAIPRTVWFPACLVNCLDMCMFNKLKKTIHWFRLIRPKSKRTVSKKKWSSLFAFICAMLFVVKKVLHTYISYILLSKLKYIIFQQKYIIQVFMCDHIFWNFQYTSCYQRLIMLNAMNIFSWAI